MTSNTLYSYRFAKSTDIDTILKGILEILFLEENKTSFFSEEKNQEQHNLICNAIYKNTIIVSENNNSEVVGFIWFNITNKSFYGVDYGNVENQYMFISYIWVTESFRNKGIAKQLYDKVINYAKDNNIKKIWLDIYMSNEKSINFHTKLGFHPEIMLYSKDI